MQGDPYGTQTGAYGLAHLIASYLNGMRYEPNLVSPEVAHTEGTGAVDAAMDQAMTEQWQNRMRAAKAGQQAVGDAMSKVKRSPKADKQATQDWINKMRAAREGQKAVAGELAKPEPESNPITRYTAGKEGTQAVQRALAMPGEAPNLIFGPKRTNPDEPTGKPPPVE